MEDSDTNTYPSLAELNEQSSNIKYSTCPYCDMTVFESNFENHINKHKKEYDNFTMNRTGSNTTKEDNKNYCNFDDNIDEFEGEEGKSEDNKRGRDINVEDNFRLEKYLDKDGNVRYRKKGRKSHIKNMEICYDNISNQNKQINNVCNNTNNILNSKGSSTNNNINNINNNSRYNINQIKTVPQNRINSIPSSLPYNNHLESKSIHSLNDIKNKHKKAEDFKSNHIKEENDEVKIEKKDSKTYLINGNEFEDLTEEWKQIQNKDEEQKAYEKKILGLIEKEKESNEPEKSFLDKIEDFYDEHREGVCTVLDLVGTVFLYGPSIARTIVRCGKGINSVVDYFEEKGFKNGVKDLFTKKQREEADVLLRNRDILISKNKDYFTIIKLLPSTEIKELKNKAQKSTADCIICLSDFMPGETISALPCCHVFHSDCIEKWLIKSLFCPICKFEVTLSSIVGNKEYED